MSMVIAEPLQDAVQHVPDALATLRVQVGGRLVEQEQPGPHGQDAGERKSLLFAPGQRVGRSVPRVRKADRVEGRVDPGPDLVGGDASVLQPKGDVVTGAGHDQL